MDSKYVKTVEEDLAEFARDGDVLVNGFAGGKVNQTVSTHVALMQVAEQKAGIKGFGCYFCEFLSWAVQKNHCPECLKVDSAPMTVWNYIRAFFWFLVGLPLSPLILIAYLLLPKA